VAARIRAFSDFRFHRHRGRVDAVNLTDGLDGLAIGCTGDRRRRFDGADVCSQQLSLGDLPRDSVHSPLRRADGSMWRHWWRSLGFSLVQRPSAEVFMRRGSLSLGERLRYRGDYQAEILLFLLAGFLLSRRCP